MSNLRHGMYGTTTYKTWQAMNHRCRTENTHHKERYKDRGIFVCERWLSFENFFNDMGERPDGMTLDRIDNNKPYSPENCRWATKVQQSRNKANNIFLEYLGTKLCLVDWGEKLGIDRRTLKKRIALGWEVERIITTTVELYKQRGALKKAKETHDQLEIAGQA